jgi:hypothetical protein
VRIVKLGRRSEVAPIEYVLFVRPRYQGMLEGSAPLSSARDFNSAYRSKSYVSGWRSSDRSLIFSPLPSGTVSFGTRRFASMFVLMPRVSEFCAREPR